MAEEAKETAESLLATIESLMNRNVDDLTEMPKGKLTNKQSIAIHGVQQRLRNTAFFIKREIRGEVGPVNMPKAFSKTSIAYLVNTLADHMFSFDEEHLIPEQQIPFVAVDVIRRRDCDPKLREAVKQFSPFTALCLDSADLFHRVVDYEERRASQNPSRGTGIQ